MRALLQEGQSLEFFIEGGRSRDGRVNTPKLGLLAYVMDAVLDGALPKVRMSTTSACVCRNGSGNALKMSLLDYVMGAVVDGALWLMERCAS